MRWAHNQGMSNNPVIQFPSSKARQDVAASVRAHMAVRGVKDTELARAVGWTQSYTSRRTNAAISFSVDDLGLVADYFGLQIVDLVQMPKGRPVGGGNHLHGVTPLHRPLGVVGSGSLDLPTSSVKARELAVVLPFARRAV